MTRRYHAVAPLLLGAVLALPAACRHRVRTAPVAAAVPDESHCWWAVLRTTLPPDPVAGRFERGFAIAGFTGARSAHAADTAWAQAGPTALDAIAGVTYEARAVAYRAGDSTHFRYWTAVTRPAGDTAVSGGGSIALCGRIARAAAVPTVAPREPTGEESLTVWRRRP